MIKLILKWLWDFNHAHKWELLTLDKTRLDVMGLKADTLNFIYQCECGQLTKVKD